MKSFGEDKYFECSSLTGYTLYTAQLHICAIISTMLYVWTHQLTE